MTQKQKKILVGMFCLYCLVMLWLLFGREISTGRPYMENIAGRVSLKPFHTILRQLKRCFDPGRPWLMRHSWINLTGNVFLFLPLGVFLPLLWEKLDGFWRVVPVTALVMTLVEIAQVLTLLGRGDVDDVILNVAGAALGYGFYKLLGKKKRM